MVFTHLPSNLLLILVAFMPSFPLERSTGSATSPVFSGLLLQGPALALGLPFIIAGALKAAYDLTLWAVFRRVRVEGEPAIGSSKAP